MSLMRFILNGNVKVIWWRFQTFFSIQGLFWNNEATCNIQEIYGWYMGGIRVVYGGILGICGDIRGYTQYIVSTAYIGYTGIYGGIRGIYGDIRGYTQYKVSIAYIGYTGIYGDIRGYTGGIRVVYGCYTGGIRVSKLFDGCSKHSPLYYAFLFLWVYPPKIFLKLFFWLFLQVSWR